MTTLNFRKIKTITYKPGKSKLFNTMKAIKLSANESALGMSSKAKKILESNKINISKYPDGKSTQLRKKISIKFKIDKDKIICGSGSDEIIQLICQLFLKPNDEVVVPQYSFLMYRIYANIVGGKVLFAKEKNYKISVGEILKKVTKKTKIIFLANPNNPTGTYIDKNELISLRKKLRKNILLVIDDAYDEYMIDKNYSSGLEIFKNKNNVFVLRTFSKIYGLASLRIGWGYGDRKIIKALNVIKPPFNVNKIAQLCAIEALKDNNFIKKSVKHNFFWAKKIKKELEKYNISTNNVSANFLLLNFNKCKFSAEQVNRKLQKNSLILRETKIYGIKNSLRITIGNIKENKFFLNKIKIIFKNV
jgi:histidinol-phosphate aminotransferase